MACGLAIEEHRETLFVRREATQLGGVIDEFADILNNKDGYNGQDKVWRISDSQKVVFGSTPHLGDEVKYQGRARDLLIVDEAANMLESQVHFLKGWVRSTKKRQRCRTLLCSNPPTSSEGQWLVEWFAPWLDTNHELYPHPPGELLWYVTSQGREILVDGPKRVTIAGERLLPQSRTFIPAKVQDNAYLRDTAYIATLQALPEPLRSQMLYGDFTAGREDGEWQVIPSAWVDEAMARWEPRLFNPTKIVSAGVDPSRGGADSTVMACREDWYYHELQEWDGRTITDGQTVAGKVIDLLAISHCPVHVDVIGIGASVVDILKMYISGRVIPVNAAEGAKQDTDWSGTLSFANKRAQLWWQFRDLLNPANGHPITLPRDQQLKAELCAPTYQLKATGILIESKEQIKKRLGRSTDKADAVIMAAERSAIMGLSGISGRTVVNV